MIAFGVLMVLWPGISALAACITLGIFCMIAGVYTIARYFKLGRAGVFFQSDMFFGICSVLVGGLLLLHPYGAAMFLPIAVGISLVINGIRDLYLAHCISNAVKASKNDEVIDVEWRSID